MISLLNGCWKLLSMFFGALFLVFLINSKLPILPVTGLTFALSCILLWFTSMSIALFGLHKLMQCKEPISSKFLNKMIVGLKEVKPKELPKLNTKNLKKLVTDIDKYFISKWYCNISLDESFTNESCIFLEESLSRLINVQLQVNYKTLLLGISNIYLKHLKEFRRTLKRREKYGIIEIQELYRYAHLYSNAATNRPKEYYILQLTTTLLRHFINSELWNSLPCHILVAVLARKFTAYLLNMISNPEFLNYVILMSVAPRNIQDKLKLAEYGRISLTNSVDVVKAPKSDKSKNENLDNSIKVDSQLEYTCEVDRIQNDDNREEPKRSILNDKSQDKLQSVAKTDEKNHDQIIKLDVVLRRRKPLKKETLLPTEKLTKSDVKSIDPVKIYEPKSSTKTWRNTRDLACVYLGQDPLLEDLHLSPPQSASKIGAKFCEVGVKTEEGKNQDFATTNLFNEVVNMTSIEGLKSSIKPILSDATERTLHNIKDIQESTENTVHNALQKIEDFQVIEHSDVENLRHLNKRELDSLKYPFYIPPHSLLHTSVMVSQVNTSTTRQGRPLISQSKDEAVGVVEGILDFGRAGFRKGLKLTGLQDNIENAKASITQAVSNTANPKEKSIKQGKFSNSVSSQQKSSSVESAKSVDSAKSVEESCWLNPIEDDSPNIDGQLLLEKRTFDESTKSAKLEEMLIPSISTEHAPSGTNSPDPEYEEAADLASSIAKLRSLLQQRSSESSLSTPALSPMPDEYRQLESEATSDMEVDGVMPSFYKFCTKTASGVLNNTLNTLKTALPSNSNEHAVNSDTWMFKADLAESDVLIRMKKLLSERKEFCVLDKEIDTAYEAIDSIDFCQASPLISSLQFEDELDEFELKIPLIKTLVDIFCELLADTNSAFIHEPIVKAFLLILGSPIEKVIEEKIEHFREYFAENLITIPEKSNTKSLSMEFSEFIDILFNSLSDTAKFVLGNDTLKSAVTLMVSSLQTQQINQDIALQVFELLAMKLIEESSTPPVSA